MALITAVVDVQDSTGASIVQANADGTRPALVVKVGAGLAATYAKSGDLGIVTLVPQGSAAALSGASLTLGSQSPAQYQEYPGTTVQTTGPELLVLTEFTFPASKFSIVIADVFAWLKTSTTAFGYANTVTAGYARIGSGSAFAPIGYGGTSYSNGSPAAPFASAGSQGSVEWSLTGNTITLYAEGINAPSAWSATTYTVGQLVTKSSKVYGVISISGSGTSTTGPSGTGTTVDNSGGNQVVWDYIGAGTSVPITWCATRVQVFTP